MNNYLTSFCFFYILIGNVYTAAASSAAPQALEARTPHVNKLVSAILDRTDLITTALLGDFLPPNAQAIDVAKRFAQKAEFTPLQKKQFLQKAIWHGDIDSMFELGKICIQLQAPIDALRWYVLAFENYWMVHGTHHSTIANILRSRCAPSGTALGGTKSNTCNTYLTILTSR